MPSFKIKTTQEKNGIMFHTLNEENQEHSFYNRPAVKLNDLQVWYFRGKKHRLDGPAVIDKDKEEFWILGCNISKELYDSLPRVNGKIEGEINQFLKLPSISHIFVKNNKFHNEFGPAIDGDNLKYWLIKGEFHNEFGPSIIENFKEFWYIKNEKILEEEVVVYKNKKKLNEIPTPTMTIQEVKRKFKI